MTFLDPIVAVQREESEARLPSVFPEEFYIKYREQADGSQKPEEWVMIVKKGMQNPQKTPTRWRDVERSPEMLRVLKPYYENWKSGQQAPVNGTALEAWIADPALVKVLTSVNIRSVEDFAAMEDHLLAKLNVPNLRERQKRAKAFLEAQKSTAKVSAEVAELRGQLERRDMEINELRELIEKHAIKKEKRGRPRKIPLEAT